MSKNIKGNLKHLTLSDRIFIETNLTACKNFTFIGKTLGKDPSTISKEVKSFAGTKNIVTPTPGVNDCNKACSKRHVCSKSSCNLHCKFCTVFDCTTVCNEYQTYFCPKLLKPPYVCNGCESRTTCRKDKRYSNA